eukprot:2762275-Rhodomonas_salina.1
MPPCSYARNSACVRSAHGFLSYCVCVADSQPSTEARARCAARETVKTRFYDVCPDCEVPVDSAPEVRNQMRESVFLVQRVLRLCFTGFDSAGSPTNRILLPVPYAMSGTGPAYAAMHLLRAGCATLAYMAGMMACNGCNAARHQCWQEWRECSQEWRALQAEHELFEECCSDKVAWPLSPYALATRCPISHYASATECPISSHAPAMRCPLSPDASATSCATIMRCAVLMSKRCCRPTGLLRDVR